MEKDESFNITMNAKIVGDFYIMESTRTTVRKELKTNDNSYKFKEITTIVKEEEKKTLESLKRNRRKRNKL